ncbi:isoprenylcysteine carboxylmethyltransferase family protein [Micromonospora sp. HM5-17]|jgi:protein-S-isoprenylcysteine O-methyltransferase Ste14|uniref:methyltransferase family protein n=1 Tax=Micromonospora sp. HM5-17 TaxID=2487710 RepID=UPI000F486D2B|nr:isoprenylcysteine carboxylmethyltransferase family protein [Micromonospora sp. HM5-17]ROT26079.1 isoprenylcysteine carboxylmethyltransferase family protein [Micromonospora sp. HM5-17]
MNSAVLLLILLGFSSIGLLTIWFFRRDGRFTARWWLTSLPLFIGPLLVVAGYVADVTPMAPASWTTARDLVAVTLGVASIALMYLTWGTHRIPLARYHQDDDVPQHVVTHGAYRYIRHPFYSSYLLLYLSTLVFFPHWSTLFLTCYMFTALTITAAGEERRLSASEFGPDYQRYMRRTGRFIPRLTRSRDIEPAAAPPAATDPALAEPVSR